MRTSVAGPIAAHMQRQAILSRHEDTREALAQIGARSGVSARFREVAFPYGVGERTSVADGNVCATEHPLRRKCVAAPSTQALLPRPDRWFGPVRGCRFHPLQIGVDVARRCRALNVSCLRDLGISTRRYLGWIFNPPR